LLDAKWDVGHVVAEEFEHSFREKEDF